jgi:hypothetical protein
MKFDMELFLSGVLDGSHTTRKRHLRQANLIQNAIYQRWRIDTPWRWKQKHLTWFIGTKLKNHSRHSIYYYVLTINIIAKRLSKDQTWACLTRDKHSSICASSNTTSKSTKPSPNQTHSQKIKTPQNNTNHTKVQSSMTTHKPI